MSEVSPEQVAAPAEAPAPSVGFTAEAVVKAIGAHDAVMHTLDSGPCVIEHVSRRNTDGPDVRVDNCPCSRGPAPGSATVDLGEGLYVSSARHSLGDLVRDLLA